MLILKVMKSKCVNLLLWLCIMGTYVFGQEYTTTSAGYYNGTGKDGIQYVQFGLKVRMMRSGDLFLIGWNPVDVQIGDEYRYKGKMYSASRIPEIKQIKVKSFTGQITAKNCGGLIMASKEADIHVGGYLDNSGAVGGNNKIFKEGITKQWYDDNILNKSPYSAGIEVSIHSIYIENYEAANEAIERLLKEGADKKRATEVALEAARAITAEDIGLASAKIDLVEQLDPKNNSLTGLKSRLSALKEAKKLKQAEDKKQAGEEKDSGVEKKEGDKGEKSANETKKQTKTDGKKEETRPITVDEYLGRLRFGIKRSYNEFVGGAYNVGGSQFGANKERAVQNLISSCAEYLQHYPQDQEIKNIKDYLEKNETTAALVTNTISVASDFVANFAFQLEYNFTPKKEGETGAFRQYYVTLPMSKDAFTNLFQFNSAITWNFLPNRAYSMEYVKSGNEAGEYTYKNDVKVVTVGFRFALYPRLYKRLHANIETDIHAGMIMSKFKEEINPGYFTYYLAGRLGLSYRLGKGLQLGIGYGVGYMPLSATSDTQVINDVEYKITKFKNGKDATLKFISPSIKFYF